MKSTDSDGVSRFVESSLSGDSLTLLEDIIDDTDYDEVEKPKHYNSSNIETFDYIHSVLGDWGTIHYCWGNVLKYLGTRLFEKGLPTTNAAKARWYLRKMRELIKKTEGVNW